MTRRRAGGLVLAVVAVLAIAIWAIPNMAGRAFVGVRLVASPVSTESSSGLRLVKLDGAAASPVSALKLVIRIEGRYLLPVVVMRSDPPLKVELRTAPGGGQSQTIWTMTGSAEVLEDAGDSPDGPGGAGLALVRPGQLDLAIGPAEGVALADSQGAPLDSGDYVLQAWAFGIPSATLPLTIAD